MHIRPLRTVVERREGIRLFILAGLPAALAAANVSGIYDIVERRMPQHVSDFTFKPIDGDGDTFVISDTEGQQEGVTVSCTTTSACARGLYTYVRHT